MQHEIVRFREFITLFKERRVLVVSVVNSLAVLLMACVLGIFLEVTEKRRAYAERVGRNGAGLELVETPSPRAQGSGTQSMDRVSTERPVPTEKATPSTEAPTRVLRARVPPRPRTRSVPPASSGSRDYPVEVRRPVLPTDSPDPDGLPALSEEPLPSVEDSSSFDFERPPMEE